MVNVAHYANNGATGHKVFGGILGVVDNTLFDGYNYLTLNLCTEFGCNDFGGIVVDSLGNRSHDTEEHKLFNNLGGRLFKLCCKVADGNFVANGNFKRNFLNTLKFNTAQLVSFGLTLRSFFWISLLGTFLNLLTVLGLGVYALIAGDRLVLFVIAVKLNISGMHINLSYFGRASVRSNRRRLFLLFGHRLLFADGGRRSGLFSGSFRFIFGRLRLAFIGLCRICGGSGFALFFGLCGSCHGGKFLGNSSLLGKLFLLFLCLGGATLFSCLFAGGKVAVKGLDLIILCHVIENYVKFVLFKGGLTLFCLVKIFGKQRNNIFAGYVEILCDLVYSVFNHHIADSSFRVNSYKE